MPLGSQGKNASRNSLGFLTQIDDLRLKCCTPRKNPKNNISGRSHRSREKLDLPARFFKSTLFSPADVTKDFWRTPSASARVSYLPPLGICRVKIRR